MCDVLLCCSMAPPQLDIWGCWPALPCCVRFSPEPRLAGSSQSSSHRWPRHAASQLQMPPRHSPFSEQSCTRRHGQRIRPATAPSCHGNMMNMYRCNSGTCVKSANTCGIGCQKMSSTLPQQTAFCQSAFRLRLASKTSIIGNNLP